MGGRGSGSRIVSTRPPQAQAGAQAQTAAPTGGAAARVYAGPFVHMTQQDADDMAQAQNRYDINTRLAINQYIREDAQSNGFTLSQNMNHKLENGQTLDATETYVAQRLDAAMHDLGKNTLLFRAAHKDFLEALGVQNYQNMTPAQLNAAVKGAEYKEKKFVSTAFDRSKNPFISGAQSGGREVYLNIKAPGGTKCVLGNAKQAEIILSRGTVFRATGAHFDGTTAYPRLGGALPRVVVDIEIVTEQGRSITWLPARRARLPRRWRRRAAERPPRIAPRRARNALSPRARVLPCSSPQREHGAFLAERRASKWADAVQTFSALCRRRYRRSSYSLIR